MPSPINRSIRQVSPTHWQIGLLVCERIDTNDTIPPADALAAWKEYNFMYIIRKTKDSENAFPLCLGCSDDVQLVHEGGTLSAVWEIGGAAFCKVKAWNAAMESEDRTIAFVKEVAPQISTPEVIYTWTERDRSFLILKRIEGCTLRDAWTSLSPSQRDSVVTTITLYCNILAENISTTLSSVSGKPVLEPYLAPSSSDLLGPLRREECAGYFSASSGECPPIGKVFHFYHPDLAPGNIIISNGCVAGIIDWEAAGYYPRFWIATKPSVSSGLDFCPPIAESNDFDWRKRLRIELEDGGYPQVSGWFMTWRKARLM